MQVSAVELNKISLYAPKWKLWAKPETKKFRMHLAENQHRK